VPRGDEPGPVEQLREQLALLGDVDRGGRGAEDRVPGLLDALREPERRLAAELADDAEDLPDCASACSTSSTSSRVSGSK
jgi:hypothetical protein